jgi:hypothetical protein
MKKKENNKGKIYNEKITYCYMCNECGNNWESSVNNDCLCPRCFSDNIDYLGTKKIQKNKLKNKDKKEKNNEIIKLKKDISLMLNLISTSNLEDVFTSLDGHKYSKEYQVIKHSSKNNDLDIFYLIIKNIKTERLFLIKGLAKFKLYPYELHQITEITEIKKEKLLENIASIEIGINISKKILYKVFLELKKYFILNEIEEGVHFAGLNQKDFNEKCKNFYNFLQNAHKLNFFDKLIELIKIELKLSF